MSTVNFFNHGLLDLKALKSFGVSVKASENPIGFFGTGLKYAIAIALRHDCRVELFLGKQRYALFKRTSHVRGEEFEFVALEYPDGRSEDLAFTTELGKTWELWQAFREFYCNTTDEEGIVLDGELEPEEGHTLIRVTSDQFLRTFQAKNTVILESDPLFKLDGVEIHEGASEHVYYRGIRVGLLGKPSTYTYNITGHIDLTEDRTVKYDWEPRRKLARAVLLTNSIPALEAFFSANRDSYEANIGFEGLYVNPSDTFNQFMESFGSEGRFKKIHNFSAVRVYEEHARSQVMPRKVDTMTDIQKQQLMRALNVCRGIVGSDIDQYDIIVTTDLPEGTIGMAKDDKIIIGVKAFMLGTKMVANTLLEEFIHLHHNYDDETRELQNYLFDLVMTLGEQLAGEPT